MTRFGPLVVTLLCRCAAAFSQEHEAVELWELDKPPIPVNTVVPEYPKTAIEASVEGMVLVEVLVDTTGTVIEVGQVSGPAPLHQAARDAALLWEFEPGKKDGVAVLVWVSLPFTFRLDSASPVRARSWGTVKRAATGS
jgi:TonB family protein